MRIKQVPSAPSVSGYIDSETQGKIAVSIMSNGANTPLPKSVL